MTSAIPLPQSDEKNVLFKTFLSRLSGEATSRKRGNIVSNIITHLYVASFLFFALTSLTDFFFFVSFVSHRCWENMPLTETVIGLMCQAIEAAGDEPRSYFRVFMNMILMKVRFSFSLWLFFLFFHLFFLSPPIQDSFQAKRIELVLSSVLGLMEVQQGFWKVTQFSIEHLLRFARKSEDVYAWLNRNGTKLDWILTFLTVHEGPPQGMMSNNQNQIQMYKPCKSSSSLSLARR
jgi:hypothetical protein